MRFLIIEKKSGLLTSQSNEKCWFNKSKNEMIENNLDEKDYLILLNGGKYNFTSGKVESTTESDARILEIEKQKDIENAKEFYSEMKNLRLKYLTTELMKTGDHERDAKVDLLLADLAKDNLTLNNKLDEIETNFQQKYGESVILLIKGDKKI